MTIDASGNVNPLEDAEAPELTRSVGKLYVTGKGNSLSEGTVFLVHPYSLQRYHFQPDALVCLTDFHNIGTIFSEPHKFYVIFDNPYSGDDFLDLLNHTPENCPKNIYLCDVAAHFDHQSGYQSFDPITNFAYSIENDIEFLILQKSCFCGERILRSAPLIPLRICVINSSEEILLVGYPGSVIPKERALPYSAVDPGRSFITEGRLLKQSKGVVIAENNDLIAVTNSSVGGMSGSPFIQRIGNEFVAVSILLGGPAVEYHYELIQIARLVCESNFVDAKNILEQITTQSCLKLKPLSDLHVLLRNGLKFYALQGCSKIYFSLIEQYSKTLDSSDQIQLLSHNLGFSLAKFF